MARALQIAMATAVLTWASVGEALAHGGELNAEGCHTNRKTGDYHCHRGGGSRGGGGARQRVQSLSSSATYYPNCAAARAAGAAPLRVGEPGYRPGLDRDGDGVACER
ncbi:excalibur calcium-binding domain-containing protein [Caulobacter endophyticus]|uniref:excalibur calcium-binding domain-containing protein n=1 Tax=Caulobacter endophyticus TaxID=2172652 RepID=UPI002410AFA2|nr:excalibur calcium-binding domain-containing protein [Caulobacter endophyticus]MDG2528051.1 excalibur calcium-binding domain-containing protein [Caulobacter endophyticus]